mmetsp:Transcript_54623/g.153376  ORF Transcript_54623/g.153376 Transcript_54623/m.153376 type:complete len:237 (+) Transcript_54623:826-1536(+)
MRGALPVARLLAHDAAGEPRALRGCSHPGPKEHAGGGSASTGRGTAPRHGGSHRVRGRGRDPCCAREGRRRRADARGSPGLAAGRGARHRARRHQRGRADELRHLVGGRLARPCAAGCLAAALLGRAPALGGGRSAAAPAAARALALSSCCGALCRGRADADRAEPGCESAAVRGGVGGLLLSWAGAQVSRELAGDLAQLLLRHDRRCQAGGHQRLHAIRHAPHRVRRVRANPGGS